MKNNGENAADYAGKAVAKELGVFAEQPFIIYCRVVKSYENKIISSCYKDCIFKKIISIYTITSNTLSLKYNINYNNSIERLIMQNQNFFKHTTISQSLLIA